MQLTHWHCYRHGCFTTAAWMYMHPHKHSWTLSHPVPLSLLVEQNDDQLGVHLVPVLAERQITPLKRHIHQVPVRGNIEERDRQRDLWRNLKNIFVSDSCSTYLYHVSFDDSITNKVSLHLNLFYLLRQTHWHHTNSSSHRFFIQIDGYTLVISDRRTFA